MARKAGSEMSHTQPRCTREKVAGTPRRMRIIEITGFLNVSNKITRNLLIILCKNVHARREQLEIEVCGREKTVSVVRGCVQLLKAVLSMLEQQSSCIVSLR
jgi:hypothetical protein